MEGGEALECLPFLLLPEPVATEGLSHGPAPHKVREQETLCHREPWLLCLQGWSALHKEIALYLLVSKTQSKEELVILLEKSHMLMSMVMSEDQI